MPAMRPCVASTIGTGGNRRIPPPPSGERVATDPGADHRISMPRRDLSGVRREYESRNTRGSRRAVRSAIDGAGRLSDGGLSDAAPGGGSTSQAGAGDRHQSGEHAEMLGGSQSSGGPLVPGTGAAIAE